MIDNDLFPIHVMILSVVQLATYVTMETKTRQKIKRHWLKLDYIMSSVFEKMILSTLIAHVKTIRYKANLNRSS